jgi:hypothetical protein
MDLKELGLESVDRIYLTRDAESWRSLVVRHGTSGSIKCRDFLFSPAQEQLACQAGPMLWS